MKSRVAFELPIDLHNKLKKLCKKNNLGISEYLRSLIIEKYNKQTTNNNNVTNNANNTETIIKILKQIEKNTRKD